MRLAIVCLLVLFAGAARAQPDSTPRPVVAPPPAWVQPIPVPDPDPDRAAAPLQLLLLNSQSRFAGGSGDQIYLETATRVQHAQLLTPIGTASIPWDPELAELTVHKIDVIRDGVVRDALGSDPVFTVLRRETQLEAAAVLDGVHTATLQIEDLRVGDIVRLAYSYRRRAGEIGFTSENFVADTFTMPIERLFVRALWPADLPMQWRVSEAMGPHRLDRKGGEHELVVDRRDVEPVEAIESAPPRFALRSRIEMSGYRDWEEISRLFAPLYAEAAAIAPGSPLHAEIARIAAASEDPKKRAMAALRLVQDEVRYLALAMGEGGWAPAGADETWTRKFGDCKAKTALLLAILRELGIEAEAVAVSTAAGDFLRERLPQVHAFDHVIVRARIDGRSYWLDGTGFGDREIEALASSPHSAGLPIRADGAGLEDIPFYPPYRPTIRTEVTYDASKGFLGDIPVRGETIFHGAMATGLRMAIGQKSGDDLRGALAELAGQDTDEKGLRFEHALDEDAGAFIVRWSGTIRMSWAGSNARSINYQFDDTTIEWHPDFEREEGPFQDAPFLIGSLGWIEYVETVLLPNDGKGLELVGAELDRTVGGVHIRRIVEIEDGRAVARSTFRQLQFEIDAAAAAAAVDAVKEVNEHTAMLRATDAFEPTRHDVAAAEDWEPTSAAEFLRRGWERMRADKYDAAATDFEEAAKLSPEWSLPLANHAVALIRQREYDAAEAMLQRALGLDAEDASVHQAMGMLHLARGKPVQAVASLTRSLALVSGEAQTLMQRAFAFAELGEFEDAIADLDAVLASEPEHGAALVVKARILVWLGDHDAALAILDGMLERSPDNLQIAALRAHLQRDAGREEEAAAAFKVAFDLLEKKIAEYPDSMGLRAIRRDLLITSGQFEQALAELDTELERLPGQVRLLNQRCWMLATHDLRLEEALANCNEALEAEPEDVATLDSRAFLNLRLGRIDAAIADADAALAIQPDFPEALYVRGMARIRAGDRRDGQRDLAAARRQQFDIDATYRRYGMAADGVAAAAASAQ